MKQSKNRAGRVLAFVSAMLMTFTMMPVQSLAVVAETAEEIVDGTEAGTEADTPAEEGTPGDGTASEEVTINGEEVTESSEEEAAAGLVTIHCNNAYVEGVTDGTQFTAGADGTVSFSISRLQQYASDDYALKVALSVTDADGNEALPIDLEGNEGVYTISNVQADSVYEVNVTLLAKVTVNAFEGVTIEGWNQEGTSFSTMAEMGSSFELNASYDKSEYFDLLFNGTSDKNVNVTGVQTITCTRQLKDSCVTVGQELTDGTGWNRQIKVTISLPKDLTTGAVRANVNNPQYEIALNKETKGQNDLYTFTCDFWENENSTYTVKLNYDNGEPLEISVPIYVSDDVTPPVFAEDMRITNVNDVYTVTGTASDESGNLTAYIVPAEIAEAENSNALQQAIAEGTLPTDTSGTAYSLQFTPEEGKAVTDYYVVVSDGNNFTQLACTASVLSVTFDDMTYVSAADGVTVTFTPVTTEDGPAVIYSAEPVEDIAALYNEYLLPAETTEDGTAAEKEFTAGTIVKEPIKITGNDAAAYAYLLTQDASGVYVLTAETEFEINRIDSEGPTFTLVETPDSNSDRATKGDANGKVTITLSDITDKGSGVEAVYYQKVAYNETTGVFEAVSEQGTLDIIDGVAELVLTTEDESGYYQFWVKDKVGNEGYAFGSETCTPIDVNIDKVGVEFTATYLQENSSFFHRVLNTITFGFIFYQGDATVIVNMTANYSDFKQYSYFVSDKPLAEDLINANSTWEEKEAYVVALPEGIDYFSIPLAAQASGFVYVALYDKAGNRTATCVKAENGDTSNDLYLYADEIAPDAPTISGVEDGVWTNQDVVITLTDATVRETEERKANYTANTQYVYSGTDYFVYAVVEAGSEEVDPLTLEYDNIVTGSSCKRNNYHLANSLEEADAQSLNAYLNPDDGKYYIADQLTITGNTNATYYFRTVSLSGLISDPVAVEVKIQKDVPDNGTVKVTKGDAGANEWYISEVDVTMTAPTVSHEYDITSTMYYEIKNDATSAMAASGEIQNKYNALSTAVETLSDGRYTITYWTEDVAGNKSVVNTFKIKIDTTDPAINKIDLTSSDNVIWDIISDQQGSAAFGGKFFKDAVTVTAEASDALSGVSLDYQLVKDYSQYSEGGYWNRLGANGVRIVPNEKFVIIIRATDEAGNVAYCNSEGIIVDSLAPVGETMAPEIDIIPEAANANGYYNDDVTVTIGVEDPEYTGTFADELDSYAGLAEVTYRVLVGDNETQSGTLFNKDSGAHVTDKDGLVQSWTGDINVSSARNNSNDVIVEVTAVDNAGNQRVSRTQAGQIKIDVTAPTIVFDYNNDSVNTVGNVNYFDEARTVEISITERSFNGDDVEVLINNAPVSLNWTSSGSGDDTVHTAQYVFDADDDYTFAVSYTDLADNAASSVEPAAGTAAPYAFTIDTTAPAITVEYDNNNAANEKYFKSGRNATVTVVEHNFSECDIIVDGETQSVEWASAGTDTYRATVSITSEGQHTFAVNSTDKAGNIILNGEVDYGESAAPNMFIIDKLDPELELSVYDEDNDATYTNSGHAIKGVVIPSVVLSDENYESHACKLYRTRMNDINKDVTSTFITDLIQQEDGSWYGEFDTFEKKQDYDGVYTLEVTVKDLSGRTTKKSITFSVNRFGSVYAYSEDLVNMQDTYLQNVDGNIVITEYNADELDPDSVKIEITRDSTPLTDVKYTPTPALNKGAAGDSGWYEYNYTIDASNFTEDGIYKIVVSSKDAAGNHSETTNYEDKAVLFRVDRTAPELVNVSGLEKNPINAKSVDVGFEVFDAIGLAKVTVFVDGVAVKEITEFENQVNFADTFQMTEGINQHVTFLLEDKAGNQFDTGAGSYEPAFKFEQIVTISTNFFIRWYTNPALFWGSIGGGVALIALIIVLILKKRRSRQVRL